MMNYEHFGTFLKELREARNLTKEQLASGVCTRKEIYRIEKGEYQPSLYLLNKLSIKLNVDLNEYFKMYYTVKTAVGLIGIQEINDAISLADITCLREVIKKYENNDDFRQGENLQHIYYAKAICENDIGNYKESLEYCMKGIFIENALFTIDTITEFMYSNVGLAIINCISINYLNMKKSEVAYKILSDLLSLIEKYYINAPYTMYQAGQFSKKMYINLQYNLSCIFLSNDELDKAEEMIENGIEYSIKENNLKCLPNLIYNKFKFHYKKGNFVEAAEYFMQAKGLFKLVKQMNICIEIDEYAREEYPEILKFLDDRNVVVS